MTKLQLVQFDALKLVPSTLVRAEVRIQVLANAVNLVGTRLRVRHERRYRLE